MSALLRLFGPVALLAACVSAHAADLDLEVELDPASRAFFAVAELAPPAGEFRFRLHESLQVRRAAMSEPVGGGMREWSVDVPGTGKLRIEYAGTLPPLDPALDHRRVLRTLPPMASSFGSFLSASSGWYPEPAELFTYRVAITVKGGHKAIVPGRLESEAEGAGTYRATFVYAAPAEGIDLMTGAYEVREQRVTVSGGAAVRLRTYFFPDIGELAPAYLDDAARYLERYSRLIGPYPFSEFSIVASPLPTGFGMPTLTYLGAAVLKLPFIRATSLGHEVLHNWWGNGVLVDYERGNWAEGLATFMADYAFREEESAEKAREMRLAWLRDLAAAPEQRPLAEFRARTRGTAGVTGYAKAAMLFFMLRDEIGDDAFARGIRVFWQRHRLRPAGWDELREAFERASGRSLRTFFDQWLRRSDAAAPEIRQARYADGRLELALAQPSPPYALRVPVELQWKDRTELRAIELTATDQVASIEVASRPDAVRLDPQLRLWRRLEGSELPPILRQWILAPAPGVALVSAREDVRKAAESVASRFFESPWHHAQPAASPDAPLLLVGLHADIDGALQRLRLPPRPRRVRGRGTAQAWTIPGTSVAVISARDAASLEALERALPHLGAQSYVVFEGARVTHRGAWPPRGRSVAVQ